MKRILKAFVMLALISLSISLDAQAAPPSPLDPENYGLPPSIGEYKIIAVLNQKNSSCMRDGEKRMILQSHKRNLNDFLKATESAPIEQVMVRGNLKEYADWGWTVVGPVVSRSNVLDSYKSNLRFTKEFGCVTLGPIGGKIESALPACQKRGFAYDQNEDPSVQFNLNAQSVLLLAPQIGNKQTCFTAFLNNVKTDKDTFLQVGMRFAQGAGSMIWADDAQGPPFPQPLPMAYVVGRTYRFTISKSGLWYMCGEDMQDAATYTCHAEPRAKGTRLKDGVNTSVFFENANENANWKKGFSDPFRASGARDYVNGQPKIWAVDWQDTQSNCGNAPNAITGELKADRIAEFWKGKIPLAC